MISNSCFKLLVLCVLVAQSKQDGDIGQISNRFLQENQTTTSPLVNFQVKEPVLTPGSGDRKNCVYTKQLMDHVFAFSYGAPFVGKYVPPPCDFDRVTMNLTVTSRGRQFDRLGLMYLGDIEVFRTSTAEPTIDGIIWTYLKEMDQYNALWRTEQKIIFDLGNLINDIYTGTLNATLTATFFTSPTKRETADEILPISAKQSFKGQGSAFSIPSQAASVTYKFPQMIRRAVVSLSACGQGAEEFWYSNLLSSQTETFASTTGSLHGGSPFREVQLFIDGKLAGVSWPFPVIFTGGIAPGLWRPIAGIDAFDLRENEIDITPWIDVLCDGNFHTFEIKVVGLDDDGAGQATLSKSVASSWIVSGKIFLFTGKHEPMMIELAATLHAPAPQIQVHSTISSNSRGENETLTYGITVTRQIQVTSSFSSINSQYNLHWTQSLSYTSYNKLSAQGAVQFTTQTTTGADESSSGYSNTYSYPLTLKTSYSIDPATGQNGVNASLSRGLDISLSGPAIFQSLPNTHLTTTQSGTAQFLSATGSASRSLGSTRQDFHFNGSVGGQVVQSYDRHVLAVNARVVEDSDPGSRRGERMKVSVDVGGTGGEATAFEMLSIKAVMGRGPGKMKGEGV